MNSPQPSPRGSSPKTNFPNKLSGSPKSLQSPGSPEQNHTFSSSNSLSSIISKYSPLSSFRKRKLSKDMSTPLPPLDGENNNELFDGTDGLYEEVAEEGFDDDDLIGVSVAHLQSLQVNLDATVDDVLGELVISHNNNLQDIDCYIARTACKSARGAARAVVLYAKDMPWITFITCLAGQDRGRFVWIGQGVCGPSSDVNRAIETVGHIELVISSWVDPSSLWTSENCAAARDASPHCEFTVLASKHDEKHLVYAISRGLPLEYYDSMFSNKIVIGPRATSAMKKWIHNILDESINQLSPAEMSVALGHLSCALGNYEAAIVDYIEVKDDLSLGEALRRAHRLHEAGFIYKGLIARKDTEPIIESLYSLQLAGVLVDEGEYEKAEPVVESALTIRRNHHGEQCEPVAQCLCLLAKISQAQGNLPLAINHLNEALLIRRSGKNRVRIADTLTHLGIVLFLQKELGNALRKHVEATELLVKAMGKNHPTTLSSMMDTAVVHIALDNAPKALPLVRICVSQRRLLLGPDHIDTIEAMSTLSQVLVQMGSFNEACGVLEAMLDAQKRVLAPDSAEINKSLKRIGEARMLMRGQTGDDFKVWGE